MNYETDTLYIVIKNNPALLERVFNGIFTVARRTLGFSPRKSSYPFITAERWEGNKAFTQEKAFNESKDAAHFCLKDYPHKNNKGRNNSEYHMFVTMHSANEANKNGILAQAIAEAGDIDISEINTNTLAKNLFDDYFDDMVAFARTSGFYNKNWQQISLSEAA